MSVTFEFTLSNDFTERNLPLHCTAIDSDRDHKLIFRILASWLAYALLSPFYHVKKLLFLDHEIRDDEIRDDVERYNPSAGSCL